MRVIIATLTQLSFDALCMHSIVDVFSSCGGAQELRELQIAGLRTFVLAILFTCAHKDHSGRDAHTGCIGSGWPRMMLIIHDVVAVLANVKQLGRAPIEPAASLRLLIQVK